MDLGWRIAMRAAMMNVSSPIFISQPARHIHAAAPISKQADERVEAGKGIHCGSE
jgi:hypothetical protein